MDKSKRIIEKLSKWADEGIMVAKSSVIATVGEKNPYAYINKSIAGGSLFRTSVEGILFTSKKERDEFEALYSSNDVMTLNRLAIKYNDSITYYMAEKLAKDGFVCRFDKLGSSSVLYIAKE
jgi:hypothetical protein